MRKERWIMVRAGDDHVILPEDSIDQRMATPYGVVMAPNLACNVPFAVGKRASEFNSLARQVWTGRMMTVQRDANGRETIVR